jgi:hypothetical protein
MDWPYVTKQRPALIVTYNLAQDPGWHLDALGREFDEIIILEGCIP